MAGEELKRKWKGLSRWQRWSAVTACFLFLYTVSGFWILPAIARSQIETRLMRVLHRQTTVQEVKFNPYTLEVAVNGFQVQRRDGRETFVSFAALKVDLQAASLFKSAVTVKSFSISKPYGKMILDRLEEGGFDVTSQGDVSSRDFSTLDAGEAAKLLSWDEVLVKGLQFESTMLIGAGEVLVDGLVARVLINSEGVLNLSTIVRENGAGMKQQDEPTAGGPEHSRVQG